MTRTTAGCGALLGGVALLVAGGCGSTARAPMGLSTTTSPPPSTVPALRTPGPAVLPIPSDPSGAAGSPGDPFGSPARSFCAGHAQPGIRARARVRLSPTMA
jgi:hypothetical protein